MDSSHGDLIASDASKGRRCKRSTLSLLEQPALSHTARRAPPRRWRLSINVVHTFVAADGFPAARVRSRAAIGWSAGRPTPACQPRTAALSV